MIIVSNKEIIDILANLLTKAIKSLYDTRLIYIASDYTNWNIKFYGVSLNNQILVEATFESIDKQLRILLKEYGLEKLIISDIKLDHILLKINYENITEDTFDKYITLCKFYGFC